MHAITPLKPHYDHTNITNEPIFPLNLTNICRLHDVDPVIYLLISYDLIFQESLAIFPQEAAYLPWEVGI